MTDPDDCTALACREVPPIEASPAEDARARDRRARGAPAGVVDAHTHLFPDGLYRALVRWFDSHGWRIRFRGGAEGALDELRRAGIGRVVALVYAHKPGMAAALNAFVAELCRAHPEIVGVGTVLPGEPNARDVVRDAVRLHGLRGIKLHCHVQRMSVDDPRVLEVLAECAALDVPAVVHAGRTPRATAGYGGLDTYELCNVRRTERVLQALPRLRLVVPHLGLDEIDDHLALLSSYENLHLDTAMACADYFDLRPRWELVERHAHRIMYGSDFPITPYEADRELRVIAQRVVSEDAFEQIVRGTARRLWQLDG